MSTEGNRADASFVNLMESLLMMDFVYISCGNDETELIKKL